MKLIRTDYDYITHKNKADYYNVAAELDSFFSGMNVKLSDLIKGRDGKYSEPALISLINKMMQVYHFDRNDKEYMKNLLYVVIRSIQTEIKGVLPQLGIKDIKKAPLPDSLKSLDEAFKPSGYAPDFSLSYENIHKTIDIPVSFDVSSIACTLYAMFTGKILPFPNPYEKEYIAECKKNNIKPFSEEPAEDNHDFFYEDYESFPDYIAYNYDTAGNTDSKKSRTLNMSNYTFPGTGVVRSEDELTPKIEYYPIYSGLKDKAFKKDKDRILLSFPKKDSFIEAFEYLTTHNSASFCEIEVCVHTMIEQLLLNYNVSLFSDVEHFGKAFYHVKHALKVAKEVTGKRYDR